MPDFEIVERRVLKVAGPYVTEPMVRAAVLLDIDIAPVGEEFAITLETQDGKKVRTVATVVRENTVAVRKLSA